MKSEEACPILVSEGSLLYSFGVEEVIGSPPSSPVRDASSTDTERLWEPARREKRLVVYAYDVEK